MDLMLRDGDYEADGRGGVRTVAGGEEILQRVLLRLNARRGALPWMPELGSQLWRLGRVKPAQRLALARQYVAQALEPEEDLEVEEVRLEEEAGRGRLKVFLRWNGTAMTAQTQWQDRGEGDNEEH